MKHFLLVKLVIRNLAILFAIAPQLFAQIDLKTEGGYIPDGVIAYTEYNVDLVATGDFNNDKYMDVAFANDYMLNVFLAIPTGGYSEPIELEIQSTFSSDYLSEMQSVDMNEDSITDLVFVKGSSSGSFSAMVFINDGLANFTKVVSRSMGKYPSTLMIGDFDNDSHIDVASTNSSNELNFYRGDGTGYLDWKTGAIPFVSNSDFGEHARDFNGDGFLDIIACNTTKKLYIALSTDTLAYDTISLPTDYYLDQATSGDFDGDGVLDIMAVSSYSGVVFFKGNGDGTFYEGLSHQAFEVGASERIYTINLDNDEFDEVVTVENHSLVIVSLFPEFHVTSYYAEYDEFGVALGDMNNDGVLDFVNTSDKRISKIITGNKDGTLNTSVAYNSVGDIGIADGNMDGKSDIVSTVFEKENGSTYNWVVWNEVDESGLIDNKVVTNLKGYLLASGDFNGDGIEDIVTTSDSLRYGISNGEFGFLEIIAVDEASYVLDLQCGDFNGDKKDDFVVLSSGSGDKHAKVYLSKLDGPHYLASTILGYEEVTIEDFNRDKKDDIVLGRYGSIITGISNGDGTFDFNDTINFEGWGPLHSGDIDGNWYPDLCVSTSSRVTVFFWIDNHMVEQNSGVANIAFDVADFDNDGLDEIGTYSAFSDNGRSSIYQWDNNSTTKLFEWPSAKYIEGSIVGDVTGDGKVDVIQLGESAFIIYKNHGNDMLEPLIRDFEMDTVSENETISIYGLNFDQVTEVKVGEFSVSFEIINKGELNVNIPAGLVSNKVIVTNSFGTDTSAINLNIYGITGINHTITKDELFRIYPNPTTDIVYIVTDEVDIQWGIFDLTGRSIKSGASNKVNVKELEKGVYNLVLNRNSFRILKL